MSLPKRDEIEPGLKWKIEDLFAKDELWIEEYQRVSEELKKEPPYKGELAKSEDNLWEGLTYYDELEHAVERLYVYANMKYYEDTTNSVYQDLAGKAQFLMTQFYTKFSFVEPEILAMDDTVLQKLIDSTGRISLYSQFLKNLLRQKEHILSEELEHVMAKAGDLAQGPKDIFSSFNNADIHFDSIMDEEGNTLEVTHGKYSLLMEHKSRTVRKAAFESIYKAYGEHKNTLASIYNANVIQAGFFAKMRHFDSTMEGALDSSNIPVEVYQNLIQVIHDRMSLMHRYVALRKKVLGVEELHLYDVYAPLVKDYEKKVTFEEAKERVLEGLAPLGEEYRNLLSEGYNNGWIDVCENQGKRSGAFSWGAYGTHPYVFLNYQENLDNMFTLAHEMGHAIHTYYSNANQPHIYAGYRIFVAEVASTCNEALLIQDMIPKSQNIREKMYLINHFLEQFKGTVFRQTMFAEFEMLTHEKVQHGEVLTAQVLCDLYRELNQKYFGADMVIDEEIALEWARIPHFYTPFYVYQYATGFSAAVAISKKILTNGQPAVDGYLEFLKSGSSDYPIEVLKKAGVDLASPKVIEDAMDVFEELLDEFEKCMNI